MRVLVTGSSGVVGSAIVARARREHEVVGLDLVPSRHTTVVGDITDTRVIRTVAAAVDAVIHVAALHAPHVGRASDDRFRAVNVSATAALLEACVAAGARRFVFTSTTSVYGHALVPSDRAVWVTEALEPQPRDIYDETKLAAEALCREAAESGLPCIALRMSRCFAEPPRVMAIYRMYRGIDARDVAEAHVRALTAAVDGFELCNVSARSAFTESDTRELLVDAPAVIRRRYPGVEGAFTSRGWTLPGSIDRVYVSDRAREILGLETRYDLAALLQDS